MTNDSFDDLSFEQLRALRVMRDSPDREGSEIAAAADCSIEELFTLAERDLIDIGMDRLAPKQFYPLIMESGRATLIAAEAAGVV